MIIFCLRFFKNYPSILKANLIRACRVRSLEVSPKSLASGRGIEIQSGTSIDSSSCIGSYTYIGRNTHITKTKIGRYCSIANNVSIGQGEHSIDKISTSAIFYDNPWEILTKTDCTIESDVWIGVDAIVLRGVKVGVGAVIAANAVVTKDVPPYGVMVGAPARLIRYRFNEEQRSLILATRWWEKCREDASALIHKLEKKFNIS